jgi:transcriptional regulator with XRE-family HTH domain
MALQNQEIAARIRELRGARPQTLVADEMGVSERTLQNWEAGTAKPSYRSLQAIATYYKVPEEFILTGGRRSLARTGGSGETPDVFPVTVNRLDGPLEERITHIEGTLQEIVLLLEVARSEQDRISALLDRQSTILSRIESATSDAGDAAERLDAAVREADRALRSAPPARPADTSRTARKSSPRAAR